MAVDLMTVKRTYRHVLPELADIDARTDICPVKKGLEKMYLLQFHLHALINNLPDDKVKSQCQDFYDTYIKPLEIPCGPDIKPLVCGNCEGCDNSCCENCGNC